jgi:predicted ArsR family transcriptional regulator
MAKSIIPHTKWSASKTALLNLLIEHGGQTIAELSSSLGVSVPYTTKTLNELIEDGLIEVTGKKDNYSKRAPKIYDLIATSGYFLFFDGIEDILQGEFLMLVLHLVGQHGCSTVL